MTNIDITRLCSPVNGYRSETVMSDVQRYVWAELLKLAMPVITSYHTDLWWDAKWLSENLADNDEFTFFYGVRDTGTTIGTDESYVRISNTFVYKLNVRWERTWWVLDCATMQDDAA